MTSGLFAMLPGVLSTSRPTRSGWWAAVQATTQPPSDSPDRCGPLDAECVHQPDEVIGQHVDRVVLVGQVGPAVADHVVGGDVEVLGQAGDVARVGLEVAAGAVQEDQLRPGAGLQHSGAYAVDVDVAQLVIDVGELAPDADVVRQVSHVVSLLESGAGLGDGGETGALSAGQSEGGEQP